MPGVLVNHCTPLAQQRASGDRMRGR